MKRSLTTKDDGRAALLVQSTRTSNSIRNPKNSQNAPKRKENTKRKIETLFTSVAAFALLLLLLDFAVLRNNQNNQNSINSNSNSDLNYSSILNLMKPIHHQNSSESSSSNEKIPISYKVIQHLEFLNTFDLFYKCNEISERSDTAPIFKEPTLLDFHVQITTSLKILYLGDSVAMQFSQALQEATGAKNDARKVLRYSWRDHEGLHIASPVRGGGAVAGWRITGMLKQSQMNNYFQMPQTPGGGWMEIDLRKIKRSLALLDPSTTSTSKSTSSASCLEALKTLRVVDPVVENSNSTPESMECEEKDFDVVVHPFPFGWMVKPAINHFTYEAIDEAVQLSYKLFGAKTVILHTVPIQNNVIDMVTELDAINSVIYNYTNSYRHRNGENNDNDTTNNNQQVQNVLIMDLAALSFELFTHNAEYLRLINMERIMLRMKYKNKTMSSQLNHLLNRRTECCHKEYGQIIAHACAHNIPNMTKKCTRTRYTVDGMHWCMNMVGGRIHGALACLIRCTYTSSSSSNIKSNFEELKQCEKRCNAQYMSFKPIPFSDERNNGERILENY